MRTTVPLKFKKIHPDALIPAYHSSEAAGFDLAATKDCQIKPGEVKVISLGFALDMPQGYWVMIVARSSLHKKGLKLANGAGVVDSDYRGEADEYCLLLHNFSQQTATIKKHERLAQGILLPSLVAEFIPTDKLTAKSRGGFGSTGK